MFIMKKPIKKLIFLLFLLSLFLRFAQANNIPIKPKIQQGIPYQAIEDISQYWISEKLDGMRGYWTGTQLITRQGHHIYSPKWFTKNWPNKAIDGELWLGRNSFQQTVSCVRKKVPDDQCWRKIKFMIFDLPTHQGSFTSRITTMKKIIRKVNSPYLKMIEQFRIYTNKALQNKLNNVVRNNGEGLMLHLASAPYFTGRNSYVMKLKKHQDAEAKVIAYIKGKGKYKQAMGALLVETTEGIRFKIGSGFTDIERKNPPEIGSVITYKYNGKTKKGIPRFARFLRVRFTKEETSFAPP